MKRSAKAICIIAITISIALPTLQNTGNNQVDDDFSSFANLASEFLQNKDQASILGSLLQSEQGQQIGGMLMESLAGGGGGGGMSKDLLSGLGSMFTNNQGNLDTEMLSNVISMFADTSTQQKIRKRKSIENNEVDDEPSIGNLVGELSNEFLGDSGKAQVLSYLPLLLKTFTSFTEEDAQKHQSDHSSHAWLIPPLIEKLHVFWDHFVHSDLGKSLFANLGVQKLLRHFSDKNGNFNFDQLVEMVENHSFRRYWIKKGTGYLAEVVAYIADPINQKKYFATMQHLGNGFLRSRGYPNSALFDPNRPAESLSNLLRFFAKKNLDYDVDVTSYVTPAVGYIEDLIRMAQQQSKALKQGIVEHSIADKITDSVNLELIEPVLRVFRAYRYAKRVPKCDKYVMCLINQEEQNRDIRLPSVKLLLSKSSSLVASWFLTYHTSSSYWSLYQAITESGQNCQELYPVDCSDFHAEEVKVTTEYFHNEL